MNRPYALVLMSVLAASIAHAAPQWGRFTSVNGFTVKYPLSWPRTTGSYSSSDKHPQQSYRKCIMFGLGYGRDDPRRRGIPIWPGQARILSQEIESPVDLSKIEDGIRRDEYRIDSIRKIYLNSSGKDRCKDATAIYYTEVEGPDGQNPTKDSWFMQNTEIYCTINPASTESRSFKFLLYYGQGDKHTGEFNKTVVDIVRSLRLDPGGYGSADGKRPPC